MIIGVPKEIKKSESRVSMTPSGVAALVHQGHQVLVETNAGLGAGFSDDAYLDEGAQIVATAKEAWSAELVVKVKEPLPEEYLYFREGLILYTYLHLAADKELTHHLLEKRVVSIAYETIQLADGSLPLLAPMSEIAGRLSITEGAYHLKKLSGGKGILLSGVPGVERARVLIIGGGVAGTNAAKIAIGIGAKVEIVDNNIHRLRELDDIFGSTIETIYSTPKNIATHIKHADVVIGSVLIPGEKAPYLVTEEMVKTMQPGSVLIDIAIDQGGCFETTKGPTTHEKPIYEVHGTIHYSVANMPGAVPQTATLALTNATLNYALLLAKKGWKQACLEDSALAKGFNTVNGQVVYKGVAHSLGLPYTPVKEVLERVNG